MINVNDYPLVANPNYTANTTPAKIQSSNGLSFVQDFSEIIKTGAETASAIGNAVKSFQTPKPVKLVAPTPTPDPRVGPQAPLIPGMSNTTLMLLAGGLVVALLLMK